MMDEQRVNQSAFDCGHGIPAHLFCGACENPREADPTGRSPHTPGAKLDAGKAPILRGALEYFPRAITAVADISAFGAAKYTWRGWETVPNGIDRYGDALGRHLVKERIEGSRDAESGMLHAAHAAWCALARLELLLRSDGLDAEPPQPTEWR